MCESFLVLVGAGIGYLLGKKQGKREREQKELKNESLSSSSISRDKDKESTPLTSVIGSSDILRMNVESNEGKEAYSV
ncbi:MAG: hypothetical protein J6U18_02490 [Acetobacter sp.]|nr:hypothetical protein [Acetobacter sp.]